MASISTELRQLLRGLCCSTQWKYAVFWKLEHERILTWQDGYVDKMTEDYSSLDSEHQLISSVSDKDGEEQGCAMCPVEAMLLSMSAHWYSLGEGIVGKVALTGEHCWIFSNKFSSTLMPRYSEDWQLQFAAGIKTVLLVPVAHHGVVQLGSLDMVLEDSILMAQIKDLFYGLYDISVPRDSLATLLDYSNTSRQLTTTVLRDPNMDFASHDLIDLIDSAQLLTSDCNVQPLSMVQSDFPLLEDVIIQTLDTSIGHCPNGDLHVKESNLWTGFTKEQFELTCCYNMLETDMASFFLDKLTDLLPQPSTIHHEVNYSSMVYAEDKEDGNCHGCSKTDLMNEYQQLCDGNDIVLDENVIKSKFSSDSEVHKELDVVSREEHNGFIWESTTLETAESKISPTLFQSAGTEKHLPSFPNVKSWLEKENSSEYLLSPMIGDIYYASNDKSRTSQCMRPSCNLTDSPNSCLAETEKGDGTANVDEFVPLGHEPAIISIKEGFMGSAIDSLLNSTDKPTDGKCKDMQKICSSKYSQLNERKVGSSEFHRARPRDRQLIQDRMKELRELIPNASKCSIDSLLDRTVKHMLFLRGISEQAEKLTQPASSKNKADEQNSANQIKKQHGSFPLIVEELDQPGHILVEMLCKEYGLFLEIAHIIKGLQLTILKGALESRSDKLWAHFIIKASKGFSRIQILCPLMHLLQRS